MGLDVSHDCWSGAYSRFYRFRNALAEAAGLPVREREESAPSYWRDEWEDLPGEQIMDVVMGKWNRLPEDPLLVLLIHSDCDGIIPAEAAPFLAGRLEQLAPSLAETDHDQHRTRALQFAAGLLVAAEAGEDVEFS
jgi:hypothetical protein